MGSAVAADLSRSNRLSEIGIGDVDYARAKRVVAEIPQARAFKIDVSRKDELSSLLKKYDAVVNATWYEYNLQVMEACFEAKCDYNDLGGLYYMTRRQLRLKEEARKAGVTAIVGGGESPGVTNVLASLAANQFFKVDRVKILVGAREQRNSSWNGRSRTQGAELRKGQGRVYFPFSVSTVIDEYSKDPIEYLEGRLVRVPPLSGNEVVNFPRPVGKNNCHYCLHSEVATLPQTIQRGVRYVEFKLGVSEEMYTTLKPLIDLGLTSESETIRVDGSSISPKQFLVNFFNSKSRNQAEPSRAVAIRVRVLGAIGRKENSGLTYDLVCGPSRSYGIKNATALMTGVAGSIFGQLLASGRTRGPGVLAPEEAVDPKEFIHELDNRKIASLNLRKSSA